MKLLASRTAQRILASEFVFNHNNWVVDSVDGAKKTLGSTVAASTDPGESALTGPVANTIVFDCANLPAGAVIVGGEVIVETAYTGSTAATIKLGIAGNDAIYLASTSMTATGRSAVLLTTPLGSNSTGQNVRATIAYTVANATAGKVRVRIQFTIDGRAADVYPA